LTGQNAFDLDEKGVVRPSACKQVLLTRKASSVIMPGRGGKLLSEGMPVMDHNGEIQFVVVNVKKYQPFEAITGRQARSESLVFINPEMKKIVEAAKHAAFYDFPVLLQGETGTGKDVLAKKIHDWSRRSSGPL
jgi:transcriptional regulator with PAS, ATPase and Fis domain